MDQAAPNLQQLIVGFRITQLIHVVAKLNVADRLAYVSPAALSDVAKSFPSFATIVFPEVFPWTRYIVKI